MTDISELVEEVSTELEEVEEVSTELEEVEE